MGLWAVFLKLTSNLVGWQFVEADGRSWRPCVCVCTHHEAHWGCSCDGVVLTGHPWTSSWWGPPYCSLRACVCGCGDRGSQRYPCWTCYSRPRHPWPCRCPRSGWSDWTGCLWSSWTRLRSSPRPAWRWSPSAQCSPGARCPGWPPAPSASACRCPPPSTWHWPWSGRSAATPGTASCPSAGRRPGSSRAPGARGCRPAASGWSPSGSGSRAGAPAASGWCLSSCSRARSSSSFSPRPPSSVSGADPLCSTAAAPRPCAGSGHPSVPRMGF